MCIRDRLIISVFQPFLSAHRIYILNKSEANKAASSPPAPALISSMTSLESKGSTGFASSLILSITVINSSFKVSISSWASSLKSSSFSNSLLSFIDFWISLYLIKYPTTSEIVFLFFESSFISLESIFPEDKALSISFSSFWAFSKSVSYTHLTMPTPPYV